MTEVYFSDVRAGKKRSLLDKTEALFDKAGFGDFIEKGDMVAVKVHFGERGNTAFVSPIFIRRIVNKIKACGGKPFLTDTSTLYVGSRANAVDHLTTAIENGFDYSVVGAPLVIADGLNGKDYFEVEIDGKHFKKTKIASGTYLADCLIAVSHFKGHEITGFGGALKNIGMGLGCRSAKQEMHSDVLPEVNPEICAGCKKCIKWCPAGAIKINILGKAEIEREKCIGCGECTVTCPFQAIAINWETEPDVIQEKIAEYALGAVKNKIDKVGFFNFVMNITPDCDCWGWSDAPIVGDVGILASHDPVAIDQASVDLVNSAQGMEDSRLKDTSAKDKFRAIFPSVDWSVQLSHGKKMNLGKRAYRLIKVE